MLAMAHGTYYNSPAEQVLAHKLGVTNPREFVVGFGVPTLRADPQRFRSEFDLASPYLIYSGRLEEAKNYHTLADYFARYKQAHGGDLKLVVMGDGPLRQVKTHADFIYTGFRKGQDMYDAIAGALALCQPSLQESFSIVIMEAWALGVPVMVNAGCPVTAEHALQSQGGLIFSSYSQFVRALDTLVTQPEARATLGHSGKQYVSTRYNWDAVMQRMETALGVWLNGT
jgi:glycosyltransferase involved in cell wall biosynthesis